MILDGTDREEKENVEFDVLLRAKIKLKLSFEVQKIYHIVNKHIGHVLIT